MWTRGFLWDIAGFLIMTWDFCIRRPDKISEKKQGTKAKEMEAHPLKKSLYRLSTTYPIPRGNESQQKGKRR